MRIAHVNPDPGIAPGRPKGAAVHVDEIRRALVDLGAEVLAVDEGRDGAVREHLDAAHVAAPVALVYQRYALERFAAFEFARENELPFVLEVNAPLAEEERRFRGRERDQDPERERRMFAAATAVMCVSSEVARWAVERGAPPERTLVRPNAVDARRFRPRGPDDALRRELAPAGAFVVGFHGRLRPWHRFDLLVAALEQLVAEGLPVHLLTVGEGPYREEIEGRLPPARATLVPWVHHAEAALYVACYDALALSYSTADGTYFSPLKLLEGMACGAVPVVPALGDLEQVVVHEQSGLVYPAGDPVALAAALRRLMLDPVLHRRLSLAARASAEPRSWQAIAREVLDLAGAPRPA
ncbi:MAG: glycosyltransferase family 4 protein [Planctomycetota bacterium]